MASVIVKKETIPVCNCIYTIFVPLCKFTAICDMIYLLNCNWVATRWQ